MVDFNEKDIKALKWMFERIKPMLEKAEESQKDSFMSLQNKVLSVASYDVPVSITSKDINDSNSIIIELNKLCEEYQSTQTDSSPEVFENLQKAILAKMDYLGTLKDKIGNEAAHMKDVLREFKARRAYDIKEEDAISLTQANTQVERDKLYTKVRDSYYDLKGVATSIRTKYEHYSDVLRGISQSFKMSMNEKHYNSKR